MSVENQFISLDRKMLEKIIEMAPVAICIAHDSECKIITGNHLASVLFESNEGGNISAGSISGTRDFTRRYFKNGKELAPDELPMQKSIIYRNSFDNETIDVLLPGGNIITLSGNATPILDESGNIQGSIATFIDITRQVKIESELKDSTKKWHTVVESIPDYISILDENDCFIYLNHFAAGFDESNVYGKNVYNFISDDSAEKFENNIKLARNTGKVQSFEYKAFGDEGQFRDYFTFIIPLQIDGVRSNIIVVSRDITDQKRAETGLRKSEEKFRALIANIPDVLWTTDENGNAAFISQNYEQIMGFSPAEVLIEGEKIWFGRIHPDDYDRVKNAYNELIKDNKIFDIEYRIKRKDGKWIWLHDYSIKTYELNGGRYADGILRDITERKRIQEELQRSYDRYRNFIQQSHDAIYRTGFEEPINISLPVEQQIDLMYQNAYLAEGNHAMAEMYNCTSIDELIGKKLVEFHGGKDNPVNRNSLKKFIESGYRTQNLETNEISPAGGELWFLNNDAGVIENNCLVGIWGTAINITERKKIESDLIRSEQAKSLLLERLNDAQHIAAIGNWDWDLKSNTVWWSDETYDIFGVERDKYIPGAEANEKFYHPDDLEKFGKLVEKSLSTGSSLECDIRLILKDGREKYCYTKAEIKKDSNGNPARFAGIIMDISKRRSAERALLESESKFRAMFENSVDAIGVSLKGTHIIVNQAYSEIFGYENTDAMIGVPVINLIAPESRAAILENIRLRAAGGDAPLTYETRAMRKDGHIFEMDVHVSTYEYNKEIYTVVILRDITERKRSEADRQRLHNLESLGVLAGGIAHDFNNMLAVMLGKLTIAMDDTVDRNIISTLSDIEKTILRATSLTKQLLTFSKGGIPVKSIFDISRVIMDTAKFSLSGSNIIPQFNIKHKLFLEADSGQISQVIQNMVINSKQAMPDGGIIEISTEDFTEEGNKLFIKITIKDTGSGISSENINKIFDPYFTTKEKGSIRGSGLGLSVCYSIIQRHNGKIFVESEAGIGTTFIIFLPATEKPQLKDEESIIAINKILNILIMDDEDDVRETLALLLKRSGHRVTESNEGQEAIYIYQNAINENKPFDLVFLDLTIRGGKGGMETLKSLREIDPNVKSIICSGYSENLSDKYLVDGFKGFLAKPYLKKNLLQVINEIIRL